MLLFKISWREYVIWRRFRKLFSSRICWISWTLSKVSSQFKESSKERSSWYFEHKPVFLDFLDSVQSLLTVQGIQQRKKLLVLRAQTSLPRFLGLCPKSPHSSRNPAKKEAPGTSSTNQSS